MLSVRLVFLIYVYICDDTLLNYPVLSVARSSVREITAISRPGGLAGAVVTIAHCP